MMWRAWFLARSRGPGFRSSPRSSDVEPGPAAKEEGRELRVVRDPAAPQTRSARGVNVAARALRARG
eukprot:7396344-Alexandrium_andersonii.AAC.1